MPGIIIVGVDGSGHSQRALEWAMKEAAVRQVPLRVITVHPAIVGYFGGMVTSPQDVEITEQVQTAVKAEVDKVLAQLSGPHPESVAVTAVHGFPVQELVAASKEADMVVLGSRGAGGFTRMLLGSTAGQVVQHADCPVVIIPPEDRDQVLRVRVAISPASRSNVSSMPGRISAAAPSGDGPRPSSGTET